MWFDFEAWQDYLVIDAKEHLEFGWKGESSQKLGREGRRELLDWIVLGYQVVHCCLPLIIPGLTQTEVVREILNFPKHMSVIFFNPCSAIFSQSFLWH